MRILWISHVVPYPPKAGVLLRAYHLLKGVTGRHTVDLFAFIQEPWLRMLFDDPAAGLNECRRELAQLCGRVEFAPIPRMRRWQGQRRTALAALFERDGYMAGWLRSAAARERLLAMRDAGRYDLVHFDTIALAGYRELFAPLPATLGHHNIESDMLLRRAQLARNPLRAWYFRQEGVKLRRYERAMAGHFAAHITCSELDAERLRANVPGARTVCVPNGVDVEYFRPAGLPQRPDSAVFVGTLNWYPNIDAVEWLLREVWPAVRQARPAATLDIAGANAPLALRELAARTPGVTMHGFVADVRPLIESSAVYLCPIRDGGGTKLKILDACAMQSCIVAHPVATEGIDLVPDVHVRHEATAGGMAAATLRLFDDAGARRQLGQAARARVAERYAFPAMAAKLADAFAELA